MFLLTVMYNIILIYVWVDHKKSYAYNALALLIDKRC